MMPIVGRSVDCLVIVCAILFLGGCSKERDYGKETYPLTGRVYVDGEPASQVSISLEDVNGMDQKIPSVSQAITKEDGTFAVSTFEAEDGVPAGEYVLTFKWGKYNPFSKTFDGDKLNGRYADPETSDFKVTVEEGEATDLGRIDLTSE